MKVKFWASVGYVPCREEIVDLPDDFTDEDIEEEFNGWCDCFVEYGYEKVDS